MQETCKQEGPIATLTEAVKILTPIMADTVDALKTLAAQNERLIAVSARQDKMETHLETHLEEIYPRLRAVEEKGIKHDAFVEQHKEKEEKGNTLSTYVVGGLTVASIIAVVGFLLYLYGHSGYATRDEKVDVEKVERRERK